MDPRPADAPADGSKSSRAHPPPPADGRSKRGRRTADGRSPPLSPPDGSKMERSRALPTSPADGSKSGRKRALPTSPADGSKRDRKHAPPTSPADGSMRVGSRALPPSTADGSLIAPPRPADGSKWGETLALPLRPADGSKWGATLAFPLRPADGSKWGETLALPLRPADGSKRSRALAPPRPADGSSCLDFGRWLGQSGVILVLFETPSGFAVLHYDGVKLFRPNSLENIWSEFIDLSTALKAVSLQEFKIFEDKTRAINSDDGVSSELAEMINTSLWPGQKLAVAKKEYKDIIERSLGIDCLFDSAVLELMWGLKNLIKVLVPDEKLELTNEDRSQISLGMKAVLSRHGVEADANLVNSDIIDMASIVYESDRLVSSRDVLLQHYGKKLLRVSGIDSSKWGQLKLATALKLVCYPKEEVVTGDHEEENVTGDYEEENVTSDHEEENVTVDHEELLSETEAKILMNDAASYEVKFDKRTCLDMYQKIVWASGIRFQALEELRSMVKEAKTGFKLHQGIIHGRGGKKWFEAERGTTVIGAAPVRDGQENLKLHQ